MAVLRMPEWVRNHPNEQFRRHYRELLRSVVGEGENAATLKNLFEANSILKADTAKQPEAVVAGTNVLLGRESGEIDWLTSTQVKSLLGLPLLTVKEDAAISESVTISNSDFETGDLTGWSTSADAGAGPAAANTDPRWGVSIPAAWGSWYCAMGDSSVAAGSENTISRSVDVSGLSADWLDRIDSGEATFTVKVDLLGQVGVGPADDTYSITITFKDSGGTTITTTETGTLVVPGGLESDKTLGPTAAAGCRTVDILISCVQWDTSSGMVHELAVDNVRLSVSAAAQSVSSVDTIEVDSGKLIDDGGGQVSLDLSGDGSPDFVGLSDTPSSLAAGNIHRVNAAGTALEAVAPDTSGNVLTSDGSQWISQAPGAGSGSGLALEDSSTATGAAEFLQVTVTSTPSTANRLEFHFRSILPEIDNETLFWTFILDDDSELTTTYDYGIWFKFGSSALDSSNTSGGSSYSQSVIGNGTTEGTSYKFVLLSLNDSTSEKVFEISGLVHRHTGEVVAVGGHLRVATTKSIKGMRVDTDNTGDMLEAGEAQAWIQT